MQELQIVEKILLKKKAKANLMDIDISKDNTKTNPKGKAKKPKNPKKIVPGQNKKKKTKKAKGKYFHCGVKGHWKRNCLNCLAQKKKER